MAQFGSVISKYRKLNNLTQSQLAEKLFVSPQAVSKWEKNQSEPDLATIKKLADIFEITVDDFFNEEKSIKDLTEEDIITADEELLVCEICQESFTESEIAVKSPYNVCKHCQEELNEEQAFFDLHEATKPKKVVFKLKGKIAFIVGAAFGLVSFLILLIMGLVNQELGFTKGLVLGIVVAIFVTTFMTQMFFDSWLKDFFFDFIFRSIRMPGIIFSLSIDGIIKLILIKLLFGLIVFVVSVVIFLFGLLMTIIISPVSYVYELIRRIKRGFDYEYL